MITIDDGHPLSYEHEAEEHLDHETGTVELVCECGNWSGKGTFDQDTWEADEAVQSEWMAHVYSATGRQAPKPEAVESNVDDEGFCESPVRVTMAVSHGIDIVFLWSCLQHADEWATTLEAEFGMAPERAARRTASAKCGHQGNQSMVSVAVDSVEFAVEVDMDAVRAFNRGGAS